MSACVTDKCTSILDKIVQTLLPESLVNLLNTTLIHIPYLVLNLWTLVHIGAGISFFYIWQRYSKNIVMGFVVWLALNILFELFEYTMARQGLYPGLFFEEAADIIWDFIANQVGFVIAYLVVGRYRLGQR